jgi:hypothetical protein
LAERGIESMLVGDALSRRFLRIAIREGHLAGRAVGARQAPRRTPGQRETETA